MSRFLSELKRRNVFRVAIAYVLVAWVLLQIADVLFPALGLPEWTVRLVAGLLLLGFPAALMFAWAYELTPGGLKREADLTRGQARSRETGRKLDYIVIALLTIIVLWFSADKFLLDPGSDARRAEVAAGGNGIAVLPFVNMSDDPANEYFSDGISEELLNVLAKIEGLRVIGRTSSFQFKNKQEDLRLIGEKLGVEHLLEGSVRKSGTRVRVTAKLIAASDGSNLWSSTYNRELDDIFRVQDEIAGAVVQVLKGKLLGSDPERVVSTNTEAYDLYLRAVYLFRRLNANDREQGYLLLQRTLELDPEFAPAWFEQGRYYVNHLLERSVPTDEGLALAWSALHKGIQLDPDSAQGHYLSGFLNLVFEWNWRAAEQSFRRVLALEANHAAALSGIGLLALGRGQIERALDLQQRSLRADPLRVTTHHNLALTNYRAGQLQPALDYFNSSLQLANDYVRGRYYTSVVLLSMGKPEEALKEAELEQGAAWRLSARALAYLHLGQPELARPALHELEQSFANSAAYPIAQIYALQGDVEQGVLWLERAFQQNEPLVPFARTDPLLGEIRDEPRFVGYFKRYIEDD